MTNKTPMVYAHFPPFDTVAKREDVVAQHKKDGKPDYVVGFLFDDKGNVVLIRKTKPEWQKGLLNGVGGKIEKKETPMHAMRREFFEETGTWVWGWRHFCIIEIGESRIHFFVAHGNRELTDTTEEHVDWYQTKKLKRLKTVPNLQWLVPMAQNKDMKDTNVLVIQE